METLTETKTTSGPEWDCECRECGEEINDQCQGYCDPRRGHKCICLDCFDEQESDAESEDESESEEEEPIRPPRVPYEDDKYKWNYDDCGILCRYDKEAEEWEVMEPQCVDCGHKPEACDCEED